MRPDDERLLQEICTEAGNRVTGIARRLSLLTGMERLVIDWQEGLLFEALQGRETVDHSPEAHDPPLGSLCRLWKTERLP